MYKIGSNAKQYGCSSNLHVVHQLDDMWDNDISHATQDWLKNFTTFKICCFSFPSVHSLAITTNFMTILWLGIA